MARISRVSRGPLVRLGGFFTSRLFARLTGREPSAGTEPVELYAHLPVLMCAYGLVEAATARLHRVDKRLLYLAELKAATLTHCEYCIDLGSQVARHRGVTDAQLRALSDYRASALFTEVEKLVLDYAVGMSRTPVDVSDALVTQLRNHLDDADLVELTHTIALENHRGRFNRALGVDAAGFSAGMTCAVPTPPP